MNKNLFFLLLLMLISLQKFCYGFSSSYKKLEWPKAGSGVVYCLDITDVNWNIYLQGVRCGNFSEFSPVDYVRENLGIELPNGFKFGWRVWVGRYDSSGAITPGARYGGPGYEGAVLVGEELSYLGDNLIKNLNNIANNVIYQNLIDINILPFSYGNYGLLYGNNYIAYSKQVDQFIIYNKNNFGMHDVLMHMSGLFDDKFTTVAFNQLDNSLSISSNQIDYFSNKYHSNSYLSLHAESMINGGWVGYEAKLNIKSNNVYSYFSYIDCFDKNCKLSTSYGNFYLNFLKFINQNAWYGENNNVIYGANLSYDKNLLSVYVCKKPFSKVSAFDLCSFFSFKKG